MESDDDYQSFSPLEEEPSPQPQTRRLKRLKKKKATEVSNNPPPPSDSIDPLLGIPRVDFARLEALEASAAKTLDSFSDDSNESSLPSQIATQMESKGNIGMDLKELDSELAESEGIIRVDSQELDSELAFERDRKEAKRALAFDDMADIEEDGASKLEKLEKKRAVVIEGDLNNNIDEKDEDSSKKKKNKRPKSDNGDDDGDMKSKASASDKRRQEKVMRIIFYSFFFLKLWYPCKIYLFCCIYVQERKTYLKQLHAESQRLLRGFYLILHNYAKLLLLPFFLFLLVRIND